MEQKGLLYFLSTQLTEDRHRHTSGPVQTSVPLHTYALLDKVGFNSHVMSACGQICKNKS